MPDHVRAIAGSAPAGYLSVRLAMRHEDGSKVWRALMRVPGMMQGIPAVLLILATSSASAQSPNHAAAVDLRAQLLPILSGVPKQGATTVGLLPKVLAEARVAWVQSTLIAQSEDLTAIHQYAADVLHAIDPALAGSTTGQGLGVRPGLRLIAERVADMAPPGSLGDVKAIVPRAQSVSRNVLAWCDGVIELATSIRKAKNVKIAHEKALALIPLAARLTNGMPRDGGTLATLKPGQGGLLTLQMALGTLLAGKEAQVNTAIPVRPAAPPPALAVKPPTLPPLVLKSGAAR